MIGAIVWRMVTARLAGPVAVAAAVVLACLLAIAAIGRTAEAARADRLTKDRDQWRAAAANWRRAAGGWRASFQDAEKLRAREAAAARVAVDAATKACAGRVAGARRSAAAIKDVVTEEVSRDPRGCPARGLVPAGRLRDALIPRG